MHLKTHIVASLSNTTSQTSLNSSFQHPVQLKTITTKHEEDNILMELLNSSSE